MAYCKYLRRIEESDDPAFDALHSPGMTVPHSGIYRCPNCGDEVACNAGNPFPPQNHHQHPGGQPIKWQLLVYAVQQE